MNSKRSPRAIAYCITTLCFTLLSATQVKATNPAETILFIRNGESSFETVYKDMSKDLTHYKIKDFVLGDKDSFSDFASKVREISPDFMVLMDNKAVDYGIKLTQDSKSKLTGLGLMALNLQKILKTNPSISGVAFEPPAYTLITQFRYYFRSAGQKCRGLL